MKDDSKECKKSGWFCTTIIVALNRMEYFAVIFLFK